LNRKSFILSGFLRKNRLKKSAFKPYGREREFKEVWLNGGMINKNDDSGWMIEDGAGRGIILACENIMPQGACCAGIYCRSATVATLVGQLPPVSTAFYRFLPISTMF